MKFGIVHVALMLAAPAAAQDYQSQASDALAAAGQHAGVIGVNAAIRAQSGRGGSNWRGTGFDERYVRTQCAGVPRDRARFGSNHRRVRRWTRICGRAGL